MRRWILALLALGFMGSAANAACPYTGNTTGTDSAAILNAMNDVCANTGSTSGTSSAIASPGSDATKAVAVQGVTNGKPLSVSFSTTAETPRGYSQITSLSSAAGLGSVPALSVKALIQVEGQAVRYRDDGTNPTTSVGMLLNPGDAILYDGTLSAIKFIETAASAKLNVSFY